MPQLCERKNATGGLTEEGDRGSQGGEGEREEEQKSWREICHGVVTKRAPAALTVRLKYCMFYVRVSETVREYRRVGQEWGSRGARGKRREA